MTTLMEALAREGYEHLKEIEGRGLCGIRRFIFTVGVCYGLNEFNYAGRFCFNNYSEALSELNKWDGICDIGGDWIKHKGEVEYSNPNKLQDA